MLARSADDGACERHRVSLGRVVGLCERHNSSARGHVAQEPMCVPVISSAHDDDIPRPVHTLPSHSQDAHGLEASHARASDGEVHRFTEPEPQVCQARRSPSHERRNHTRGARPAPLEPAVSALRLKHSEPLHNCDSKHVLTTVLTKLYRRTVGG